MLERIVKGPRLIIAALVLAISTATVAQTPQSPPRTPSDTVREFYRTMRLKKFREAFAMSIYKPAIDGLTDQEFQALRPAFKELTDAQFVALRPRYQKLTPEEFQDLLPDFDRMAAAIPEKVDLTGEQISGENATVFVKVKEPGSEEQAQPISLIRIDGVWIVGDRENEAIVKKAGKDFFFNARIDTHHAEVQDLFQRITLAQVVYSQQHNGQYGNLAELIAGGLVPKDLEATDSTGYRFQVNKSADGKSWNATAEPAQYGRTGKLSFYLDSSGVRSGDNGGKPLLPKN
jgi:hypothetical protein